MLQHQKTARARAVSRARTRTTRMQKLVLRIGSLGNLPLQILRHIYSFLITEGISPFHGRNPRLTLSALPVTYFPYPGRRWTGTNRMRNQWNIATRYWLDTAGYWAPEQDPELVELDNRGKKFLFRKYLFYQIGLAPRRGSPPPQ